MAANVMPAKVSAQTAVVSPQTPLRSESQPTAAAYNGRPCFACNQEGHWIRDCPNKWRKTSAADDSVRADPGANSLPNLMCACNRGPCQVRDDNGSKIYRCPLFDRELYSQSRIKCGYTRSCPKPEDVRVIFHEEPPNIKCPCGVGWCLRGKDDSGEYAGWSCLYCPGREKKCCFRFYYKFGDQKNVGGSPDAVSQCYPLCSCGAGRCRLWMERKNGRHLGRLYFTCPILKGQGACNLIIWLDHLQGKDVMQHNYLPPEQIEELDGYAQMCRPNVTGSHTELFKDSLFDNMTIEEFDMHIDKAHRTLYSSCFENEDVYQQIEMCSNFSGAPTVTETTDGMSSEGHPLNDEIVFNGDVELYPQQPVQNVPNQVTNPEAPVIYPRQRISFRQRASQWAQWLIEDSRLFNV